MTYSTRVAALLVTCITATGCGSAMDQHSPQAPPPSTSSQEVTVTGSISGLLGSGLVLLNNVNGQSISIEAGASSFTFKQTSGGAYSLSIVSGPASPSQACVVFNGYGVAGNDQPPPAVDCNTEIAPVGGTVSGLSGTGLKLAWSDGAIINLEPGSTEFVYSGGQSVGVRYSVGVAQQPAGPAQTCTVKNAKGIVEVMEGVSDIAIQCLDNDTSPLSGTYSFQTSAGGGGYITFFPDGTYSYVVRLDDPACGTNDGDGVEYGAYNWNATTGAFAIRSAVVDTNGSCGVAAGAGAAQTLLSGYLEKLGTKLQLNTGSEITDLTPADENPGSVVGSFAPGTGSLVSVTNTGGATSSVTFFKRVTGAFTVFAPDGRYVSVETQDAPSIGASAGAEWGCVSYSPYVLDTPCYSDLDQQDLDLNGAGGLSELFARGYGEINVHPYVGTTGSYLMTDGPPNSGYMERYWWQITAN